MHLRCFLVLLVLCASFCRAQEEAERRIDVRVQISRFVEFDRMERVSTEAGTFCRRALSEIEYRVVQPRKYQGIRIIAHIGGYKAGSPYTTIGCILDATIPEKAFEPGNLGTDRVIKAYTLGYSALECFKIVSVEGVQEGTDQPGPNKSLQGTEGNVPSSSAESEALRP